MKKKSFILFMIAALISFSGCADNAAALSTPSVSAETTSNNNVTENNTVAVVNKGTHFEVILNFNNGESHKNIGKEYGKEILNAVPDYENIVDSYIAELTENDPMYKIYMGRVADIEPQVNKEYCDEIEGIASAFNASNQDIRGDGKLSVNELFLMNFVPDVIRATQCCALSVYGQRSQSNENISARVLDWFAGSKNQLAQIQAVVTIKNSEKSICTIGFLGYMGCITGFNDNKVFAAILDSATSRPYTSASKNSYPFDLRYALENYGSIDEITDFMKSPARQYTFGHLIFLSDPDTSKVLENNISEGIKSIRDVRTESSTLNDKVTWDISNSIGCVNSFLLKGNLNNHSVAVNIGRFDNMKKELQAKGDIISMSDMESIVSFHTGAYPGSQTLGDIYNDNTQQIIVIEPAILNLEIFFRPMDGVLPANPVFEKISVSFD